MGYFDVFNSGLSGCIQMGKRDIVSMGLSDMYNMGNPNIINKHLSVSFINEESDVVGIRMIGCPIFYLKHSLVARFGRFETNLRVLHALQGLG